LQLRRGPLGPGFGLAEASVVLLEGGVDAEGGSNDQRAQLVVQRAGICTT
jgi:hypothetical protein